MTPQKAHVSAYVAPETKKAARSALRGGENLSRFIEIAILREAARRRSQKRSRPQAN